jgi:uncharacterized membrane protein
VVRHWTIAYGAAAAVFLSLDALWLGVLAGDFYADRLAAWLAPRPNWAAALVFYVVYLVGLLVFAVRPARVIGKLGHALGWGGAFGFFTYFTYDMTNLATLRGWPFEVVLVDVAWGTFISAVAAGAGFAAVRRWTPEPKTRPTA